MHELEDLLNYHKIEAKVRARFNARFSYNAIKERLPIGSSLRRHEFDLYERGRVIGGISTSRWKNRTKLKSNNTAGQDRAAAELLWLSLWLGAERRVHVLTDRRMATETFQRFQHGSFQTDITIYHYDRNKGTFARIGTLKPRGIGKRKGK